MRRARVACQEAKGQGAGLSGMHTGCTVAGRAGSFSRLVVAGARATPIQMHGQTMQPGQQHIMRVRCTHPQPCLCASAHTCRLRRARTFGNSMRVHLHVRLHAAAVLQGSPPRRGNTGAPLTVLCAQGVAGVKNFFQWIIDHQNVTGFTVGALGEVGSGASLRRGPDSCACCTERLAQISLSDVSARNEIACSTHTGRASTDDAEALFLAYAAIQIRGPRQHGGLPFGVHRNVQGACAQVHVRPC